MSVSPNDDQLAIKNFQKLLQINTISSHGFIHGTYSECVELLKQQCEAAGIGNLRIWEGVKGKPILIATITGSQPELKSILFTGHYDVVPVDLGKWTTDPFGAQIVDGKIYARGSQDMKCCLAAYIEAFRRLNATGFKPTRSLHFTFVPDEEIGGLDGMGKFIETDLFKSLNVGFAIDEGLASPDDIVPVFFGERAIWWIMIKSTGATGHASRTLHPQTATARLLKTCEEITAFRDSEAHKHTSGAKLGDVFSVNITALKAGHSSDNGKSYALNVIPSEAEAGVDIRIPPSIDLVKFEQEYLKKWTREEGMSYTKVVGASSNPSTSIGDDNEWWQGFKTFCNEAGLKITPEVFPAATDVRFLRSIGIPSLGFTPIPSTPVLLHDHDEFLAVDVYLRAIKVYQHLMVSLTSMV